MSSKTMSRRASNIERDLENALENTGTHAAFIFIQALIPIPGSVLFGIGCLFDYAIQGRGATPYVGLTLGFGCVGLLCLGSIGMLPTRYQAGGALVVIPIWAFLVYVTGGYVVEHVKVLE